jgi:lysophospholipase L1-like esterase
MTQSTPPPPENGGRFLEPWPLREALVAAGWSLLALACLVLGHPVATALFSADGEALDPEVTRFLDLLRFTLSIVAILLLVTSRRPWADRRLPIARGTALACGAAVLAAFLLGEGVLRVRGFREWGSAVRTPLPLSAMRRPGDQELQPGRYASRAVSDFNPTQSRVVFFTVNRVGLRGKAPALPKPVGTLRIVCLGGSTTFGYHVTDGEEWPARLGERLGRDGRIEVLNAGRPGATTWNDFRALRDRLIRLEPDVVILYEGFNDLWRAVRRHAAVQDDYGSVEEDVPPTWEPLDLGPPRGWPMRLSFGGFYAGRRLESLLDRRRTPRPVPDLEQLFHPAIVDLYATNLAAMIRLCRAHDMVPVVATFAGCDDAQADAEEGRRRLRYVIEEIPPLDVPTALRGMELYRDQTRQVARREGAPLVDLARQMPKDTAFYSDTVHFTPRGEDRLSELLVAALQQEPEVSSRLLSSSSSPDPSAAAVVR